MSDPAPPYADSDHGGSHRMRWVVLFATMFCYLFYYTGRQSFGFAIPGIKNELGIDEAVLGWVSAAFLWMYAIGQAINGNLGDRFGGRRMMSLGAVLSCALNWVVSFAGGLLALLIPWGANGYAQSMGWAPGSRVLSNWWPETERGKVYGLYLFAAGMSSVLSFVTALLIVEWLALDWRWIFRLPVLLLLLGGVVYFVGVRDRPERPHEDEANRETPPDGNPDKDPVPVEERSLRRYARVLGNGRFMTASVAIGFQSMARYGLLTWVPVHFLGEGFKGDPAGKWVTVALPVGMALGAFTNGWLSDRLFRSRRWPGITLFLSFAAAASMTMWFVPADSRVIGIVVLFLCGFFAYGPQASFWALVPDLLGRTRVGTGTGVMNASAYFFAGLGGPLIGWVIKTTHDTSIVFPIVAAACFTGAVIAPFVRR